MMTTQDNYDYESNATTTTTAESVDNDKNIEGWRCKMMDGDEDYDDENSEENYDLSLIHISEPTRPY